MRGREERGRMEDRERGGERRVCDEREREREKGEIRIMKKGEATFTLHH